MFGGRNKKAARQSLFNVEINARRLILATNNAYQADLDDKQAFRADTEKILKVEDDLYRDILLALDNGASLDEICYRIEIAKIKEATVGLQAKIAIDDFVKVLAAHSDRRKDRDENNRKLPDMMRDFLIAIVFLVGTVLLLGGELFFGHLFSTPTVAIGIGAVLCFLAAVAKNRIDRDIL